MMKEEKTLTMTVLGQERQTKAKLKPQTNKAILEKENRRMT